MIRNRILFALLGVAPLAAYQLVGAQAPASEPTPAAQSMAAPTDRDFFESRIRPVFAQRCYGCHSSKLASPKGELVLDTKAGLLKGGASGPEIVPGKPAESRLFHALSYSDNLLQMPPSGKLPENVIADFEQWIAAGAADPRVDEPASAGPAAPSPYRGMSIEEGRKWWAFQPVKELPAPAVKTTTWSRNKIDAFILAKLEKNQLTPSARADRRTLVERVYVDLLGYKPTYEEVQAFLRDISPKAYENLIDRLLASPHYGERWARHWLDVARYGEDNPTSEATNPPFPYAWRYRDWTIEALNADVPYDRFIKLQLAADKMPDATRTDQRALGYLGVAPVYHKDQKLSAEVIGTFMTDDWDDRIDTLTRGVMGVTAACARCHDHKFDPIKQRDYYALQGVFASTMRIEKPLFEVDPAVEARYLWVQRRLFDLHYAADNLTNEASTVDNAPDKVTKWMGEIRQLQAEMAKLQSGYPQLVQSLEKYYTVTRQDQPGALPESVARALGIMTVGRRGGGPGAPAAPTPVPGRGAGAGRVGGQAPPNAPQAPAPNAVVPVAQPQQAVAAGGFRRRPAASTEPFMNVVYDAANIVDGSDKDYTFINYIPDQPRDMPILRAGNVAAPGQVVPRGFLDVLTKDNNRFTQGSGRLELAEKIFTDAQPLTARVIVNRVWGWHFGKPLVATASDFGTQGDKPSHPELLEDLTARFIAHGWSLKWLNKEIMMSATYRQGSRPRPAAQRIDEGNTLLWRMNPGRLDAESYRDSLIRAAGLLKEDVGGPSDDLDDPGNYRRAVYGRISRSRSGTYLGLFDFPEAMTTSPGREATTTALQQLFVLNSALVHNLAATLAKTVESSPSDAIRVRDLFRKTLARDPTPAESQRAVNFIKQQQKNGLELYAQVLLGTNEEIFLP